MFILFKRYTDNYNYNIFNLFCFLFSTRKKHKIFLIVVLKAQLGFLFCKALFSTNNNIIIVFYY